MGGNSSREFNSKKEDELRSKAAINFNKRVREYNFAYHGYYVDYIEWCRAQYELECIPECCRQGSNYTPQYDHWGYQIH